MHACAARMVLGHFRGGDHTAQLRPDGVVNLLFQQPASGFSSDAEGFLIRNIAFNVFTVLILVAGFTSAPARKPHVSVA